MNPARRPRQHHGRWLYALILGTLFVLTLVGPASQVSSAPSHQATPTGILAEAIGEANLRAGPGIEYDLLGTIRAGTRYGVLGQHDRFPWILIEYPNSPDGQGWVFADLVTLSTTLEQVPYITETVVISTPSPAPSLTPGSSANPAASVTPPPTTAGVFIETDEEVNARFGPGVNYPRIGQLTPGQRYAVISRHTLFPWLLIDLPGAPNGVGWVYMDVVTVVGDIYTLPVIMTEQVGWPTLTPTPPYVVTSVPPWPAAATTAVSPNTHAPVDMSQLGDAVLSLLLSLGFAPEETRIGSVFVQDLASGENFSLGRDIAYSGMSLIKIPILVTFYRGIYQPADAQEANLIANTMICSGNHTANELLARIGGGDPFVGAQQVTTTMRDLGLRNTFISAPFRLGEDDQLDRPVYPVDTDADQTRTAPDFSNQTTPEDLGWLLTAVYQCAQHESGPLMDVFPGQFTPTECRQMILAMSANQINVLTEAGVPAGTRVAHKHGWIDDTHGDAAIVFTPGGDFVLAMALFQPEWLSYELSWPLMAEIARLVYNAYNPDSPLNAIHPGAVDETCDLAGSSLLAELSLPLVPPIE